ncbi:RICIN domain-containing protein [Streptomyces sp. NPDC002057]|uniref:RICIN domain-containing protein n=1 Tax=Streptomyces sp. NPDC002057 TaxID=3154664 RepID=UPI00332D7C03
MSRSLGRVSAVVAGLAAVVGTMVAGAPSASAAGTSIGAWGTDNKCLAIYGQAAFNGAPAILWDCNGNPDQQWTFVSAGEGYVRLANGNNGCVDIPNSTREWGVQAIQWICHSGHNQQWRVENLPNSSFRLRNRVSGLCLDASGFGGGNGTPLIQWECNGGNNQRWAY